MRTLFYTGLLLCIVTIGLLSDAHGQCQKYKFTSKKYIRTESGINNQMKLNLDVWIKPYKGSKDVYTLNLRNPEVLIDRQTTTGTLDLNKCPSNILPATRSQYPVLVVLDKNGLLQEIKVDKNSTEVDINVQLFVASLLQINRSALQASARPMNRGTELMYVGQCPVSYEVNKDGNTEGESMRVVRRMKLNDCNDLERSETAKYPHTGLMTAVSEMMLRKSRGRMIPEMVLFTVNLNNVAEVEPGNKLSMYNNIEMVLNEETNCAGIPNFVNTNAMTIKRQVLRPVNQALLQKSDDMSNDDLRQIYKGLASDGTSTNIYQDLYERALRCWEMIA